MNEDFDDMMLWQTANELVKKCKNCTHKKLSHIKGNNKAWKCEIRKCKCKAFK
jgi:hypothetical protein